MSNSKGKISTRNVVAAVGSSQTLAALVAERAPHPATGLSAFYWISAWGLTLQATGKEPTSPTVVAAALGMSKATAYSWQRAFRKVFPEYTNPAILWSQVGSQVHSDDPSSAAYEVGAAEV